MRFLAIALIGLAVAGCTAGERGASVGAATGAIVGGPDSSDEFSDERSDYSHAEPTTYINAAFIGPVAALIGLNSN